MQKESFSGLKDVLDATTEAQAIISLATAESSHRLAEGNESDEAHWTAEEGDPSPEQGSPTDGSCCLKLKSDEDTIHMLSGLSDQDRYCVNQFQKLEWLKLIDGLRRNPHTPWQTVARAVGRDLLDRMREAAESQYATREDRLIIDSSAVDQSKKMRFSDRIADLAQWTPLRLVYAERELLRLLESTLYISDYTDNIDILHEGHRGRQIVRQIRQICSILTGLVLARDYEEGQRLIKNRDFKDLASFFQACFEIGRRYKVLNPERLRDSYGKLMYFLMDSRDTTVSRMLDFDCVAPLKTVGDILRTKRNGIALLQDPLLSKAVREVYSDGGKYQTQIALMEKEEATKELIRRYATVSSAGSRSLNKGLFYRFNLWALSPTKADETNRLDVPRKDEWESKEMSEEDVELAIYSLKDHMTFLRFSERPVDTMLKYLEANFSPKDTHGEFSLGIEAGRNGARLSHGHVRQYQYVRQSLMLWREILRNFLKLWFLADQDLLSSANSYRLRETGQGLNRIQACPRIHKAIHRVIEDVQKAAGGWIGSDVVHLGDHNVPNALMFIDKYTQIPRFINPIVQVIENVPRICSAHPGVANMINEMYGSTERLIRSILTDFFRHAFDGSGADNFFDAGSCIDGRLTSAWNWCSNIEKKKFYPIFLLTGFTGFDGKF